MSYHLLTYSLIFLPVVMLLYQLTPRKFRCVVLLTTDYIFFYMISRELIAYLLIATAVTYGAGHLLERVEAKHKGEDSLLLRKRAVLAAGIIVNLSMLVVFKYLGVFGVSLIAPVGISYYTLQTISYMTDVYRKKQKADSNYIRLSLYLSFFPQIMEGPVSRYGEIADALYSGRSIEFDNLEFGYQRIIWGLFKKMLIADRLAPVVLKVFGNYEAYDGAAITVAVVCFTCQLYMEFSGCMDIVIGSGQVFGVSLPENFRQPFFASGASDFWRRWHITLGTWLKDYVFYPVSLAKPVKKLAKKFKARFGIKVSKFVAPTIALFAVWLVNGIWHGAGATYIFYGMYYFVLIFIENITEQPLKRLGERFKLNTHKKLLAVLRGVKLFVIVNIGEMFFRATSLKQGFGMFVKIFTDFNISSVIEANFGIDEYDFIIAAIGILIVLIIDILHERGVRIRSCVAQKSLPVRWGFWYAAIACVVIFGAYGAGYTIVDMIYAAY